MSGPVVVVVAVVGAVDVVVLCSGEAVDVGEDTGTET